MKKLLVIVSIALAAALLLPVAALAFSADVLDNPTYDYTQNGFVYKEASANENGAQKLFYAEYNSTQTDSEYEWVIHSIRNGTQTTLSTVMQIANDYENTTGRKVMFAANGDYFDRNTGANMESYVNNGIVISKGSFITKHCIGFDNNGKVALGRMTEVEKRLVVYVDGQPHFFEIDKFNQQPAEGEIAVYDKAGSYTVTDAGVLTVKTDSVNMSMYPVFGTDYTMTATGVQQEKSFRLNSGQFAVVYTSTHNDLLSTHAYGEEVSLVEIPAGDFLGCTWVLGGYDMLVNNFTVNTDCHDNNGGDAAAPRTLIGIKEDGTTFVCVLDGRQGSYAKGVTVEQEAQLAGVLGAKYALELDGGGSSTAIVRIDDVLTLRNKPSDDSMRAVSNAILLVKEQQSVTPNPDNPNEPDPDEPSEPQQPADPSIPTGDIIAIAVCVVVVIACTTVAIVLIRKKR